MSRAAASRPLLLATVDHAVGRVQVKGHLLTRVATQPTVKLVAAARHRPLDRADMSGLEPVGQLTRGRRRRSAGHRPQRGARRIRAHYLHVIKTLPADQLTLRQRDNEGARRQPAPALLDRCDTVHRRKLGVNQLHEAQIAQQLTGDREPRMPSQRRIIRAKDDPSGPSVTVSSVHPQGELLSPIMVTVTTRHDHIHVGRQSPANAGLSRAQGVTATVSPATPPRQLRAPLLTDLGQRTPAARNAAKARSPRPARDTPAGCWSRAPGTTAARPPRARHSNAARTGSQPRSSRSPGKPNDDCTASGNDWTPSAASAARSSPWPSPASSPVSAGRLPPPTDTQPIAPRRLKRRQDPWPPRESIRDLTMSRPHPGPHARS